MLPGEVIIMSILDYCKKHLVLGFISQAIITGAAAVVAVFEGMIVLLAAFIIVAPGGKYGPPPTPTPVPLAKYGAPPVVGGVGQIDPGTLLTPGNLLAALVALASLLLYAWAIFGWVFWGSVLYLRTRDKK